MFMADLEASERDLTTRACSRVPRRRSMTALFCRFRPRKSAIPVPAGRRERPTALSSAFEDSTVEPEFHCRRSLPHAVPCSTPQLPLPALRLLSPSPVRRDAHRGLDQVVDLKTDDYFSH